MPQQIGMIRHRYKSTASATTHTHYGYYVPHGERWFVALISVKCDTTANADVVVSVDGRGYDHVVGQETNLTAGEWVFSQYQIWLEEGERFKFDWDGIVSGEVVEVHITGHVQFLRCPAGE